MPTVSAGNVRRGNAFETDRQLAKVGRPIDRDDGDLELVELCTGLDEDCDGETDEGVTTSCYSGTDATRDVGLCHDGNGACGSEECEGDQLPQDEICNYLDDNCNGTGNEDGASEKNVLQV